MSDGWLAPGSDEAIEAGCTCPVLDNRRPWTVNGEPLYWRSEDCPLHGVAHE